MNYRGYNPEREVLEKHLKDAISSFAWVYETASTNSVSKQDLDKIEKMFNDMKGLHRKLKENSDSNE